MIKSGTWFIARWNGLKWIEMDDFPNRKAITGVPIFKRPMEWQRIFGLGWNAPLPHIKVSWKIYPFQCHPCQGCQATDHSIPVPVLLAVSLQTSWREKSTDPLLSQDFHHGLTTSWTWFIPELPWSPWSPGDIWFHGDPADVLILHDSSGFYMWLGSAKTLLGSAGIAGQESRNLLSLIWERPDVIRSPVTCFTTLKRSGNFNVFHLIRGKGLALVT